MWFMLFASGAVAIDLTGGPALRRHLAVVPGPELLLALYFLATALARMLVLRVRLAAFERRARALARRAGDVRASTALGDFGRGLGRGAVEAVTGDLVGASLSLATALFRGATGTLRSGPVPQRERRRAVRREQLRAAACIVGVGLVCAGLSWKPLVAHRARRAAAAAVSAAGFTP
jgi:hypothetical protein